ncbi:MAG: HD domain-containing protein, partial [Clostridia bacterium]
LDEYLKNKTVSQCNEILNNALKENLITKKRYDHSIFVAAKALQLCKCNNCDQNSTIDIICAALVHDILKDYDCRLLLQMSIKYGIIMDNEQKKSKALYHSIVGSEYLKNNFNLTKNICDMVKFHTMAKAKMTLGEKIIFVADAISEDRKYSDREAYEKISFENINKGVLEILSFTIKDICKKNGCLCLNTIKAYNYYLSLNKNK